MYDWAEFRHFRYLLKILEKRGFRLAAEELFTSQPNLTVQARQFQDNASVRLFHKTKSGQIVPTKAGIAFVVLTRNLLEFRDEVIDAVVSIERNEISAVRLGSTSLVDESVFRRFCALHKETAARMCDQAYTWRYEPTRPRSADWHRRRSDRYATACKL